MKLPDTGTGPRYEVSTPCPFPHLSDADRAVLDAARHLAHLWTATEDSPGQAIDNLCNAVDRLDDDAAVRARRETQP